MNEGCNLNTMNAIFRQYVKPTKYPHKKKTTSMAPYTVLTLFRKGSIFGNTTSIWRRMSNVWITKRENKTSTKRKEMQ
jgi:hypothetical protein